MVFVEKVEGIGMMDTHRKAMERKKKQTMKMNKKWRKEEKHNKKNKSMLEVRVLEHNKLFVKSCLFVCRRNCIERKQAKDISELFACRLCMCGHTTSATFETTTLGWV